MKTIPTQRLEFAVAAICPDIEARVALHRPKLDERSLWWELSCCLLSSQVSYSLASEAANEIDRSGLLLDNTIEGYSLSFELSKILNQPLLVQGRSQKYRFPTIRANQLAETRLAVTQQAEGLAPLLASFDDASELRSWLVANAPGLGPKQASMLLRNVGISYDLAILDRHVLKYMAALGLYQEGKKFISGLVQYRRHEVKLRSHAEKIGISVGILDWAIWIVMRAANVTNTEIAVV